LKRTRWLSGTVNFDLGVDWSASACLLNFLPYLCEREWLRCDALNQKGTPARARQPARPVISYLPNTIAKSSAAANEID